MNLHTNEDVHNGFDYLGVHYQLQGRGGSTYLAVRLPKLQEWAQEAVKKELTCREAARFVGRAFFAEMIFGDSLQLSEKKKAHLQKCP